MPEPYRLRRAAPDESRRCFDVFLPAIRDLAARQNSPWDVDPEAFWANVKPLYDHLAEHAAEWWVAEDRSHGDLLGYARSTERAGLFELTEFFVDPARQSAGVGAALLERAFPLGRGEVRTIIATPDVRAQARYYAAGTTARFPIATLEGFPSAATLDLTIEAVPATPDDVDALRTIEAAVVEFDRGDEFTWLMEHREGHLYRRDGEPIGYSFLGRAGTGPIAARSAEDQPSILAHVESRASALGMESLSLEVPMVNGIAVRHLLARGFRFDPFYNFLMASRPFGHFDRFICLAPPFFL